MVEKNESAKPAARGRVDTASIVAGMTDKDFARVAEFQKSLAASFGYQSHFASTIKTASEAASAFLSSRVAANFSHDLAHSYLQSPGIAALADQAQSWNKEMMAIISNVQNGHADIIRQSGLVEKMAANIQPLLAEAAKMATTQYELKQVYAPAVAELVKSLQVTTPVAKPQVPNWQTFLDDIDELRVGTGTEDEDVEEFLGDHPELQAEVEELTQVIDFTDPVQRARIVNAMKLLTYLMFFAVILGSWQVVAAYASIISLMGMSAPKVADAVGAGTEKALNKISPLPKDEPQN